jgi:hypothetical protein
MIMPVMTLIELKKMIDEVDTNVHNYLRYNGCTISLPIHCYDGRNAVISVHIEDGDDDTDTLAFDMYPMQAMSENERRLFVWGIIARRDLLHAALKQVKQRLDEAEAEYNEILEAQSLMME